VAPASPFRGIILPRSETADDRHIVLKLNSGYNVGIAADAITGHRRSTAASANYKIPEKEFPRRSQAEHRAPRHGRNHRQPARLPHRGGHSRVQSGRVLRLRARARRHLQPQTEKLFGVFSENMGPEQYIDPGRSASGGPSRTASTGS
jgi:glutamyl-tRNA(Gln) amidotransferase subunit D